jgi:hypothetical protein
MVNQSNSKEEDGVKEKLPVYPIAIQLTTLFVALIYICVSHATEIKGYILNTFTWIKENGKSQIFPFVVQLLAVFIALTAFFFMYVVNVEKEEVGVQLGVVSRSILDKHSHQINGFIQSGNEDKNDKRLIGVVASLDALKINSTRELKSQSAHIHKVNAEIYERSKRLVLWSIGIIIGLMLLFKFTISDKTDTNGDVIGPKFWSDFPVIEHTLLVIITIVVIVITEFIFLNAISKHYIAVDPNYVGRKLQEII